MGLLNDTNIEWSLGSGLAAVGFFNCLIPTPRELRQMLTEKDCDYHLTQLRGDYRRAALLSAVAAGGFCLLARSFLPLVVTALSAGAMITTYESALPERYRVPLSEWPELLLTGEVPKLETIDIKISAPANAKVKVIDLQPSEWREMF